jgi:hypothetical protein
VDEVFAEVEVADECAERGELGFHEHSSVAGTVPSAAPA